MHRGFWPRGQRDAGIEALIADAAVLVSHLLQHGITPADLAGSIGRRRDQRPASLIGVVVDRLLEPRSGTSPMTEIYWTPRLVEAYLVEAADTLRRLPEPRVPGYVNTWPDVVEKPRMAPAQVAGPTRLGPPSPRAIDQMDVALQWLQWLDPSDQKIVWQRANRRPWKAIAHVHGIDRTTAWRRWTYALVTIAARLNAASGATLLQHHELQHFARDLVD